MNRALTVLVFSFFLEMSVLAGNANAQQSHIAADVIVLHGRVYTVNRHQPWAQALAIRGDKIMAVGSDAEIQKYRGDSTKIIDARNHVVLPGFTDAHVHFMGASLRLGQLRLEGAADVLEIQRRLKSFVDAHPNASWILGTGWVYSVFGAAAVPNKKYLDEVVRDRPVFLSAYDHHSYWVNSKALELAGITRETPDPPNGTIVREPQTGEATGMLKEFSAAALVERLIPEPAREERLLALKQGIHEANRFGIVRVHSAARDTPFLDLFDELRNSGELTLRLYAATLMEPPELTQQQIDYAEEARRKYHDEWIDAGAIKFIGDGVIEAHTAAMLSPYANNSSTSGHLNWDPDRYKQAVGELDRRGFQIFTHGIGDKTVRLALDAYENAAQSNGTKDARHRIEHVEDPDGADIPRFGALGVIASMQPLHALPNHNTLQVWVGNVGPQRATRSWPWHSIINNGGRVAFGSDWSVVTINPWPAIQLLLTRQTAEGMPSSGWNPEQRLTIAQAIEGYTIGGAFAGRREKTEGSLEPGKLADCILISQNPFHISQQKIGDIEVLVTIVGGKVVYESPSWKSVHTDKH